MSIRGFQNRCNIVPLTPYSAAHSPPCLRSFTFILGFWWYESTLVVIALLPSIIAIRRLAEMLWVEWPSQEGICQCVGAPVFP